MAIAAYPRPTQSRTHESNAVPPPPWTRTIPGAFSPGCNLGTPIQAKTRVGFPFHGRPT